MQTYLSVLFSILFLNILPFGDKKRTRVILPISFLILWVFLAFRYNYGVDYINYNHLFYAPELFEENIKSEPLFWNIFKSFEYYYQFIIFQATVICLTFYYFAKKYIKRACYTANYRNYRKKYKNFCWKFNNNWAKIVVGSKN